MAITTSDVRMKNYWTVSYTEHNKRTGAVVKKLSSYVDDPEWFKAHVERRGGEILRVDGPRQVETIDVGF